jgi:phosphomannomutase
MINWSPSGRNANNEQREQFIEFDKKYDFRKRNLLQFRAFLESNDLGGITIKLGGDTSFDIYPEGWDKTYALRYFKDSSVWFVGDRARTPDGNDYEIHKACEPRSFHTDGPITTDSIVFNIIEVLKEGTNVN